MNRGLKLDETDLHAFIDGELDAERASELECKISNDPALAARVTAFRSDMSRLKETYRPLIERPVPKEWLALVHGSRLAPGPSIPWQGWLGIAAAILILFGGVFATYYGLRPSNNVGIIAEALDARSNASRPAASIAIKSDSDVAKQIVLLRGIADTRLKVPDLSKMGYRLTALRLYASGQSGKAAELQYRDRKNRLFTLFLRRSDGPPKFDQFERNGLRVCLWQDDVLSTVMAGDISTAEMQRLASLAYTGLTL